MTGYAPETILAGADARARGGASQGRASQGRASQGQASRTDAASLRVTIFAREPIILPFGGTSALPTTATAHDDLHGFLRRVFACSDEVARAIGARAGDRAWPARAVILRQGDHGGETYLLLTGRAQALLYGLEGQLVLLHEFAPGDIF